MRGGGRLPQSCIVTRRRTTYTPARQRLYAYGLTDIGYHALLERQAGACAICGQVPTTLTVDHDHRTGKIRGLLCNRCNRAIGHLQDSPGVCTRAAEYLRESG